MLQKINYPPGPDWEKWCRRPEIIAEDLDALVNEVFSEVQKTGDFAVRKYARIFDTFTNKQLRIADEEIALSGQVLPAHLKQAIELARQNIEKFHASQKEEIIKIETQPGVECWRESRAIQSIGIYIPGGSAPLFSTVLMLGIPAKLAGCDEIVLCSPPDNDGKINPAILYAAALVGIKTVFCVGGIQAIAAMTFGTASIPKVHKIFGPGNQYVNAAKQAAVKYGIAIDLPAGPSELLVIADLSCDPDFVAADLLSQAEHGADSQVVLVCDNEKVIDLVNQAIATQLKVLPRKEIAGAALKNSKAILLQNLDDCIRFSNQYAPEHLIIVVTDTFELVPKISNAGSVFLGNYSCESAGDYASGTNHTLPTNGFAKNYSGVSLDSFVKKITFQQITPKGLQNIGPAIELMAKAEQLAAHKNAVSIRLKKIQND
jgi:histidinol dehydrogenase